MKKFMLVALLFVPFLIGCSATNVTVTQIPLGAFNLNGQWAINQKIWAPFCGSPVDAGNTCFFFPTGAKIYGIVWQSSKKDVASGEIIVSLLMTQTRQKAGAHNILSTHHNGDRLSHVVKSISLQPNPFVVPPNSYLWIYGDATGIGTEATSVEVQATIFTEATTNIVPIP